MKNYKNKVGNCIVNISNLLEGMPKKLINEYKDWLVMQTKLIKRSHFKKGYVKQPDNISRGDVVWVEFGINIGTELSRGHFAVVWRVDLGNVVVIPLTSKPVAVDNMTFNIGVIEELCEESVRQSYIKLDAIRSISKRRLVRIRNKPQGKARLSDTQIKLINKLIIDNFTF